MYIKEAVVNNQVGLHARPATFFIQKANEFKSSIWVEKDERRVNAKSLLGVLSLGIVKGTAINLIADGPAEKEAVERGRGCEAGRVQGRCASFGHGRARSREPKRRVCPSAGAARNKKSAALRRFF